MKGLMILVLLLATSMQTACGESAGDATVMPGSGAASSSAATGKLALPERKKMAPQPIPKFAEYKDVKVKKSTFFEYMNERVRIANDEVW